LRKLTIVVPAHNEEVLVERCVRSFAGQLGETADLLVIAHNCRDHTAERAAHAGLTGFVRVDRLDDPGLVGKACALRFGFARALERGADAVVVVDADSVVSPGFVARMHAALSEPVISGGAEAVQCRYRVLSGGMEERATLTGIAFQGFNLVRPRGRSRLGLSAGIFGNGFGMRRDVLERIPYRADSVVEDLEYHLQLVDAGIRVAFLEEATVFGEMPQGKAGNQTQRARWEGGRMLMVRAHGLRLPGAILKGRLRLLEPMLDLTSLPIAMGVLTLLMALAVSFASPGAVFLVWLRAYAFVGLAAIGYHFLIAVKAGPDFWQGMGVLAMVPRYIVWKLLLLPKIVLSSRRNAAWVRTHRDEPQNF